MDKILTVEIAEGLGNQLFMYSYAYSLSKKFDYKIQIDNTSGYFKKKNRLRDHQKYMLHYFNIDQNLALSSYRYDNIFKRNKKKFQKLIDKFSSKKKFLIEKKIKINGIKSAKSITGLDYRKLSNSIYVQGNFEDYNYFNFIKKDLIKMYKPLNKYVNDNKDIIEKLNKSNSVSIHIRQNKFTEQPHEKNDKNKVQSSIIFTDKLIQYINKSVEYFEANVNDPVFFIWSNDFTNLEKHFDKSKFNYILGNDPINDFNLFSYAKHFIVGGSTFHWWGAYLNENPNKICVVPSNINPSGNSNFYPTEWKRI
tara:strand:+ start:34 stop:960 length:927 start_codon:yes stop_codon:yes gene_type:complete